MPQNPKTFLLLTLKPNKGLSGLWYSFMAKRSKRYDALKQTLLSSQERQRRYLSLSPWDKATLSLVGLNHNKHTDTQTENTSSVFLDFLSPCLSGPCDSLQQDGQDRCFLLHPVPALPGLLGRSPLIPKKRVPGSVISAVVKNRCQLLFPVIFLTGAVQDCMEREHRQRLHGFLC